MFCSRFAAHPWPAATAEIPPYLVLLRVGLALPAPSLGRRCALTAPFHPYPVAVVNASHSSARGRRREPAREPLTTAAGRYVFCGAFRQLALTPTSRTLSGTLLFGVRTFLPRVPRDAASGRPAQLPTSSLYAAVLRETDVRIHPAAPAIDSRSFCYHQSLAS